MGRKITRIMYVGQYASAAIALGLALVPLSLAGSPISYGVAYAQSDDDAITVIGYDKPFRLDFKKLQKAIRKYEEVKPRYAPDSQLFFEVWPNDPNDKVSDISLELVPKKGDAIPITIDEQGRFVMPKVEGTKWRLVANRGAKSVAIKPIVLSPGSGENDRRLGDLRAQCPAMYVMASPSLLERAAFSALGGCDSGLVNIFTRSRLPLASAWVEEGERKVDLPTKRNIGDAGKESTSYRMPLADKLWSNEARVLLVYALPETGVTDPAPMPEGQIAPID
jgi:hypothetical protein